MSTLQVANVHFESTGANRLEYTGNNVIRVQGKGLVLPRVDSANTPSPEPGMLLYNTSTNTMVMMGAAGAGVVIPSNTTMEAAFGVANGAFGKANTAYTFGNTVYAATNSVFGVANGAFGKANTVYAAVNSAFAVINAAFTAQNTDYTSSNAAYVVANSGFGVANGAFGKANTALQNTSGTLSGDLVITGNTGIGVTPITDKFVVKTATNIDFGVGHDVAVGGALCLQAYNDGRSMNVPMELRGLSFYFTIPTGNPMTIGANGFVGIGTVSPKALLEVVPAQSNSFSISLSGGQVTSNFNTINYAGYAHNDLLFGNFRDTNSYCQTAISFGYTGDPLRKYHIGSANNSSFDATTKFVPALTVTSGGSVGIGTGSPNFKTEIMCAYNNGLHIIDTSGTVYGGLFTESGTMAVVTRSNHGLRFGTNDTTRMNITSTGNVSIGTTNVTSSRLNLKGRQRIIASPASTYEENRWFSHQGHYNIANVDNNAYSNVLMFRPYQQGTTTDPPASSIWTRVGVEVRIGGHSSAIGSGDRWARYSLDYNGSGCSGSTTLQDLATSNAPRVTFSISGWQVTLQVSGAGGAGGSFGGYCYVSLHFGGGEGSWGESIEWSLTEYL